MRSLSQILFAAFVYSTAAFGQVTTYKVGEKVNYIVHYGPITGGEASIKLTSEKLNGKEVWHSVMLAKTTGVTDAFFKVLDIYEVFIDPATQLPVKSVRNVREGR
jgi:hypothetical protein